MPRMDNLLAGPPSTLLPSEAPAADEALARADDPAPAAAAHPTNLAAAPAPADRALGAGEHAAAHPYARVGDHRGLDALRRNGWKGHGPVPWSHEPNRDFLRSLRALGAAA